MRKGSSVSFRMEMEDYERVKKTAESIGSNVSTFSRMAVMYWTDLFAEILPKLKEMSPDKIVELAEKYKEIQG